MHSPQRDAVPPTVLQTVHPMRLQWACSVEQSPLSHIRQLWGTLDTVRQQQPCSSAARRRKVKWRRVQLTTSGEKVLYIMWLIKVIWKWKKEWKGLPQYRSGCTRNALAADVIIGHRLVCIWSAPEFCKMCRSWGNTSGGKSKLLLIVNSLLPLWLIINPAPGWWNYSSPYH